MFICNRVELVRSRYAREMGHFDVVDYGLISFDERGWVGMGAG